VIDDESAIDAVVLYHRMASDLQLSIDVENGKPSSQQKHLVTIFTYQLRIDGA